MRRLAALAALALLVVALATPMALSAPLTLYVAKCGNASDPAFLAVRPRAFSPGCVGASPSLSGLHWRHWGAKKAAASGRASLNACDPSCAAGHRVTYRARMIASRIRTCEAGDRPIRLYTRTRFVFLYPAGNPFGETPGWRGYTPPDTACQPIGE